MYICVCVYIYMLEIGSMICGMHFIFGYLDLMLGTLEIQLKIYHFGYWEPTESTAPEGHPGYRELGACIRHASGAGRGLEARFERGGVNEMGHDLTS